jgi:threonine dehydratase
MDWNVSLFHFQNHGDNFEQVQLGIEVPPNHDKHVKKLTESAGVQP